MNIAGIEMTKLGEVEALSKKVLAKFPLIDFIQDWRQNDPVVIAYLNGK